MSAIELLHLQFCEHALTFRGLAPRTISWYREVFHSFLRYSKITTLDQFNKTNIQEWILNGKFNRKWQNRTIRNRMLALIAFCNWCVEEELLIVSPMEGMKKPKLPKNIPKHLTYDQVVTLLNATRTYPYRKEFEKYRALAIIAMFVFTGIRKSELINLQLRHVDFSEKTVSVESGKGNKDRFVPMNSTLEFHLRTYFEYRKKEKKTTLFFFSSSEFDRGMGEKVLPRLTKKLRDHSGIYFSAHVLRHSFATLMLEGSCDIYTLSKMMGHADISTTTIYLSVSNKLMREQMNKHPLSNFPR